MGTRRIITALFLALLVAGGLTYFMYARLRRITARPRVVQLVAAARDLPAGVGLKSEDLRLIDWPADAPLPDSLSSMEKIVGRPLIYPLGEKEPVLERDLAVPGSGLGLSVKIPAGMRATSVRSNEIVGVAGFLYPGSHVDVLATFVAPGNPSPVTQTILQNVTVLTAGEQVEPDPQGKPQTVNVVTLLLSPKDSQDLLLASTQGSIQFVLRNGADQGKDRVLPTRLDQLGAPVTLSVSPPLTRVRTVKRVAPPPAPAPAKPPEVYFVEIIQGEKRSIEKF
jgi:pilus assembly protein CpaB